MRIDKPVWSNKQMLDHFARNRDTLDQLYPSEKAFLPRMLHPGMSVLDIGCASGGFYSMMRQIEPTIQYAGVDASSEQIGLARRRYPEVRFEVADALNLPFEDNSFDLVHATGCCHHIPDYETMLREMYRTTRRYVIVDLPRLLDAEVTYDTAWVQRFGEGESASSAPYVVAGARSVFSFLLTELLPRPARLLAVGYYGKPSHTTRVPFGEVCFVVALLEKGTSDTQHTEIHTQIPIDLSRRPDFSDLCWVETSDISECLPIRG